MCRLLQGYGYPVQPGEAVSYGSTPDLTGLDGVHIECKRGEKQALYEWIEQAQRDSGKFKDGLPAIFWRKNRAPLLLCHFKGRYALFQLVPCYHCRISSNAARRSARSF